MIRIENQFGRPEIPSEQLRSSDMPAYSREYSLAIVEFALTFDAYERYGIDKPFKVKEHAQEAFLNNRSLPRTLNGLRTCLFAHQRMWRDSEGPDPASLEFIIALVERIRRVVAARSATEKVSLGEP